MKYKIDCKSLLLQKALENFLKDYLDEDGVVISDYDGDIIIGEHITKPFSKSQLLLQLENLNKDFKKEINFENLEIDMNIFEETKSDSSFEEKLDRLIDEFSNNLKQLIKEEYGKK